MIITIITMITMSKKYSPIPVLEETKARLNSYGHKGETYDELLNRLLNEINHERKKK